MLLTKRYQGGNMTVSNKGDKSMSNYNRMNDEEPCCGRCQWHKRSDSEWYCTNEDSEYYGCETNYDDGCSEVEER